METIHACDHLELSFVRRAAPSPAPKGKLKGKTPKLSDRRQAELRRMYDAGEHSISDLAEVFDVSRPTVYRVLQRVPGRTAGKDVKAQ